MLRVVKRIGIPVIAPLLLLLAASLWPQLLESYHRAEIDIPALMGIQTILLMTCAGGIVCNAHSLAKDRKALISENVLCLVVSIFSLCASCLPQASAGMLFSSIMLRTDPPFLFLELTTAAYVISFAIAIAATVTRGHSKPRAS